MNSPLNSCFYEFEGFVLDPLQRVVRTLADGQTLRLSARAFDALHLLVERRGQLVDKDTLIKALWPNVVVEENNLTQTIYALRQSLGEKPGEHRFIATAPGRGYQFVAVVKQVPRDASDSDSGTATVAPNGAAVSAPSPTAVPAELLGTNQALTSGATSSSLFLRWGALALALLLAAGAGWMVKHRSTAHTNTNVVQQAAPAAAVAVLPFLNLTGDASKDYLGDGMAEELINTLTKVPGLKVPARTSTFSYKGRNTDIRQIAKDLGVSTILEGSVRAADKRIRITAQLINAQDGLHLWSETYDEEFTDIFKLQDKLAMQIARALQPNLSSETAGTIAHTAGTTHVEAYELYLKGREALRKFTREDVRTAASYFEKATGMDPNFALAYSGLADAYLWSPGAVVPLSETNERARAAITKALTLDPTLGEARISLALLLMYDDWDFSGAEREFRRGIELSPNSLDAHHWYSHFLLAMGRIQESLTESQSVQALDPVSPLGLNHMGYHYLSARRYDQAIQYLHSASSRENGNVNSRRQLGDAYYQKRMWHEAFEQYVSSLALEGMTVADIADLRKAFSSDGMRGYLKKRIEQIAVGGLGAFGATTEQPNRFVRIASAYAQLGEKEHAFEWLERAYSQHASTLVHLREDLSFDNLRTDPRFADLLRRIGLPPP